MRSLSLLLIGAALAWTAPHASAQSLSNGDFSAGLQGWQVLGDVSVQPGNPQALWLTTASLTFEDDFPAAAGAFNRSGRAAAPSDGLEAFVGLTAGALDPDPLAGLQAYEGSIATQSFSAGVGDTLSFRWDFGTRDSFDDFAFVVVDGQVFRLAGPADATLPGRDGNLAQTGAQSFSISLAGSGTHTVAFGVVDVGDYSVTSTLAISGVQVSPVPEPAALLMSLLGLAMVAGGAARRTGRLRRD